MNDDQPGQSPLQEEKNSGSGIATPEKGEPVIPTIATNPNPRANENIEHTSFEKEESSAGAPGSEITDGEDG